MFKNISLLFLSLTLMSCGLIPNTYLAAPISGTVLNEKTKQPLAGVHVLVYWTLYKGGFGGRVTSGILHVEETITDEKGKYHFKSWGPVNTIKGRLGYQAPELLFFKPGYYYQRKGNSRTQMYFGKRGAGEMHVPNAEETNEGLIYNSQWDDKYIFLKKYNNSVDSYSKHLSSIRTDLGAVIRDESCLSKNIIKILKKLYKIELESRKNKLVGPFPPFWMFGKCKGEIQRLIVQ